VALLVGFALAFGLAVSLSKPMVELTKSAERLGAGDLTAEVTV
jgi:nitrogen fixation/metabolism regulation signal transduction histidine kinase